MAAFDFYAESLHFCFLNPPLLLFYEADDLRAEGDLILLETMHILVLFGKPHALTLFYLALYEDETK
ncbi:hypothetical protein [Aureibacillus halotolerans]|uniref:hypothetical protein n=1 Tax=Aureibacillus halotolerans TaxID=1508390 RepID=UPI00105E54DE|nr:hypothetical protein [Aureibacillus halotolerans]